MRELTFTIKIESWEDIPNEQREQVIKDMTNNLATAINRQIDNSDEGLFGNDNEHYTRMFVVSSNDIDHEVCVNNPFFS